MALIASIVGIRRQVFFFQRTIAYRFARGPFRAARPRYACRNCRSAKHQIWLHEVEDLVSTSAHRKHIDLDRKALRRVVETRPASGLRLPLALFEQLFHCAGVLRTWTLV